MTRAGAYGPIGSRVADQIKEGPYSLSRRPLRAAGRHAAAPPSRGQGLSLVEAYACKIWEAGGTSRVTAAWPRQPAAAGPCRRGGRARAQPPAAVHVRRGGGRHRRVGHGDAKRGENQDEERPSRGPAGRPSLGPSGPRAVRHGAPRRARGRVAAGRHLPHMRASQCRQTTAVALSRTTKLRGPHQASSKRTRQGAGDNVAQWDCEQLTEDTINQCAASARCSSGRGGGRFSGGWCIRWHGR
jgi:hypothetical protein